MSFDTILLFLLVALFSPTVSTLHIPPDVPPILQPNISALSFLSAGSSSNINMTQLPSRIANLTGAYNCIPSSKYMPFTRRPTVRDCGGAIRRLPSEGKIEEFKNRARYPYRLPEERQVGSCKVTVQFASHAVSAVSSWLEIGLSATEMALACIKGDDTGGQTTTGEQDKIEVTLSWTKVK